MLGVRVTTPARSLVDVTRTTGRLDQIERGISAALERGLASPRDFVSAVERSHLTRHQRAWFLRKLKDATTASPAKLTN